MSLDAFTIIARAFSILWNLFNGWYIPGTQMTPAALFFLYLVASLTLRFFHRITDNPMSFDSDIVSKSNRSRESK